MCRRRDTELLEVRVQGPVRTANPLTGFGVLLHDSFCLLNEVVFRTGVCTFSVLQRSVSGFEVETNRLSVLVESAEFLEAVTKQVGDKHSKLPKFDVARTNILLFGVLRDV